MRQALVGGDIKALFHQARCVALRKVLPPACLLSAAAFVLFIAADPFVVQGSLRPMITVRAFTITAMLSLYVVARRKAQLSYSDGAICLAATGLGVIAACMATGDPDSRYAEALALTFIVYASFVPTTERWMTGVSATLLLCYDLGIVAMREELHGALFAATNASLALAGILAWAMVRISNPLRFAEFVSQRDLALQSEALATANTSLNAANAQLSDAAAELRTLARAKNDFFANVNHELRTPLTMVLAQLQILQDELKSQSDTRFDHYLESCRRSAFRLLGLVNDILFLTRLDMGKQRFRIQPIDLRQLVQTTVADVGPLASRKQLDLSCKVEGGIDASFVVSGDHHQIERVIINLIGNAIKFTADGGTITARLSADASEVTVTVEDTGRGIAPAALDRVFERGFQEEGRTGSSVGGLGIGLHLSQVVMQAHGGSITARSKQGEGSAFTMHVPRVSRIEGDATMQDRRQDAIVAPEERRADVPLVEWDAMYRDQYRLVAIEDMTDRRVGPRAEAGRHAASVLIVDDSREMVSLLANILSGEYRTIAAYDGEDGVEKAVRQQPDLIISDVMMPKMNGVGLVKRLRSQSSTRHIPIIIVTASGTMQDEIDTSDSGVDGYLAKPFDTHEVRTVVKRVLRREAAHADALLDSKAAGLQIFAQGLAHNTLNALHFITGSLMLYSQLVEEAAATLSGEQAERFLAESASHYEAGMHGVRRVQEGVQSLQGAADVASETETSAVDINDIVRDAVMSTHLAETTFLNLLSTHSCLVRRQQVEDVLVNLLKNAQEAAGPDCWVSIVTEDTVPEPGVAITLTDTGPGMDAQTLQHVFDAYFTTKATGSGLGLSMSRHIIREHGGNIAVDSTPGEGASFRIWLPLAAPQQGP